MNPIITVKDYVEGRLSLRAFHKAATRDGDLEALLSEDISIRPYTDDGTLFLYLIGQAASRIATDVNVRDAMARFLDAKGVTHAVDGSRSALFDMVLDASPAWLSVPNAYADTLAALAEEGRSRKENVRAIKERIARDFRYVAKPPKWLQSPDWMMKGDRPLLFVGQLGLGEVLHDRSAVYVFMDEKDGTFEIRVQSM